MKGYRRRSYIVYFLSYFLDLVQSSTLYSSTLYRDGAPFSALLNRANE